MKIKRIGDLLNGGKAEHEEGEAGFEEFARKLAECGAARGGIAHCWGRHKQAFLWQAHQEKIPRDQVIEALHDAARYTQQQLDRINRDVYEGRLIPISDVQAEIERRFAAARARIKMAASEATHNEGKGT